MKKRRRFWGPTALNTTRRVSSSNATSVYRRAHVWATSSVYPVSVRGNSLTAKQGSKKPEKPHPDFPLTPNGCGQWSKKIRGKVHYFGPWDDPDAALRRYLSEIEVILAGGNPDAIADTPTVGWLVNAFLDAKDKQRIAGDLAQRTFDDYLKVCKRIASFFGKGRTLESLIPDDFTRFRSSFPATWAPTTINNCIRDTSSVFKFASDTGAVNNRIITGTNFKRVSKKRQRIHKRTNGNAKEFTAAEVHRIIEASPVQLKAMILLGINAGFGPADCGRLEQSEIDFRRNWYTGFRMKTGIDREAWLWPETITALKAAIEARPPARKAEWEDLVFLTSHRRPWYQDGDTSNPIQQAFKKSADKAGCYRKGVGHYALRHMLETHGGPDQVAVNFVMGHVESGIAAEYREGIPQERVKAVCRNVRKWFMAGKPKKKTTKTTSKGKRK